MGGPTGHAPSCTPDFLAGALAIHFIRTQTKSSYEYLHMDPSLPRPKTVPPEILHLVFEHLDVYTILIASRACRDWLEASRHPHLRRQMFRLGPEERYRVQNPMVHPAIGQVNWRANKPLRTATFASLRSKRRSCPLLTASCASHYATSPALSQITIYIFPIGMKLLVGRDTGVTVIDVFRGIELKMRQWCPTNHAMMDGGGDGDGDNHSWGMMLGDNDIWNGITPIEDGEPGEFMAFLEPSR